MIAVYITGGIFLLLALLLIIPVSTDIKYKDKLFVKVKYAGINVFDNSKPKKPKQEGIKAEKPPEKRKKKENPITDIFNKKGKIEGIKFLSRLINVGISRIIWVIRKIKFRKFLLKITISSEDAANTAVIYGTVCATVYPLINLLDQNTDLTVKEVSIYTDFEKLSPEIETAIVLKTRLIYAVIAAVSLFFAYLKIKKESDKNGRK